MIGVGRPGSPSLNGSPFLIEWWQVGIVAIVSYLRSGHVKALHHSDEATTQERLFLRILVSIRTFDRPAGSRVKPRRVLVLDEECEEESEVFMEVSVEADEEKPASAEEEREDIRTEDLFCSESLSVHQSTEMSKESSIPKGLSGMPKDKVKGMAAAAAARKRKMKQGASSDAAAAGPRGRVQVGTPSEEGKGSAPSMDVPNIAGTGTPTSKVPHSDNLSQRASYWHRSPIRPGVSPSKDIKKAAMEEGFQNPQGVARRASLPPYLMRDASKCLSQRRSFRRMRLAITFGLKPANCTSPRLKNASRTIMMKALRLIWCLSPFTISKQLLV